MAVLHGGSDCHEHPGLAVAALRDLVIDPGLLRGVIAVLGQALNGDKLLAHRGRRIEHAGVSRCPLTMTVQAPQTSMPQPYFVPVRPIRSRRTHSNGMLGLLTVTR